MTKTTETKKRARDPRLDFFRGVAMLIIFIAHVPFNGWMDFIPARFGFSDAAEMFVFCSGFAAAIAFGGTFVKAGFWHGTGRILYRVWQLYSSHVLIFFLIAGTMAAADRLLETDTNVGTLNLGYFFDNAGEALVGLLTLTYVPNYFDILPMYMVALLMVPAMMLLARVHPGLAIAASLALYLGNWAVDGGLPAHPQHPEIEWFFNPFGWQLIFFTGFALARGWIKAPAVSRPLMTAAIVFVVAAIPVSHWWIWYAMRDIFPIFHAMHEALDPYADKVDYGILRYLHFLALAYIAIGALKGREHLLLQPWLKPVITVGQQALPVFLLNMWLAQVAGIALERMGYGALAEAAVNIAGLAIVVGFAYLVTAVKSEWWRMIAADRAAEAAARRPVGRGLAATGPTVLSPAE